MRIKLNDKYKKPGMNAYLIRIDINFHNEAQHDFELYANDVRHAINIVQKILDRKFFFNHNSIGDEKTFLGLNLFNTKQGAYYTGSHTNKPGTQDTGLVFDITKEA